MKGFWIREVAGDAATGEELPLNKAIAHLRDEVSVLSVKGHGHGSRELSMLLAHLDEARLWSEEYLRNRGALLLIDKRDYVEALQKTETVETDETVSERER